MDIGADKQADYFKLKKEGRKPGDGLPRDPDLPHKTGNLPHPASGNLPRQRIRKDFHYVPDDRIPLGGPEGEGDRGICP